MRTLIKSKEKKAILVRLMALVLCALMLFSVAGCTTTEKTPDTNDDQNGAPTPDNSTTDEGSGENNGDGTGEDVSDPKNIVLNAFYVPMYIPDGLILSRTCFTSGI